MSKNLIPNLRMNLIKRSRADSISIHLKDFEFERELSTSDVNQAIAILDYDFFADTNKRKWIPSNKAYYDSLPDDKKDSGPGLEQFEKRWTQYSRGDTGGIFTKTDAEFLYNAITDDGIEDLKLIDSKGIETYVYQDGAIQSPWNVISYIPSQHYVNILADFNFDNLIQINYSSGTKYWPFATVNINRIIGEGGYPYEFYAKTTIPIVEADTPDWLLPYDSDAVELLNPDDFEIGYAYKAMKKNQTGLRYWQVGVQRGEVSPNIPNSKYYLGKDNNIYRDSIPFELRQYPTKTSLKLSKKFYKAQQDAIKTLVDNRYNENITIKANDVLDPTRLSDIKLFQWVDVHDSKGNKRTLPVSEITNTNGELEIKLGFKTTLFTEVMKG